MTRTRIQPYQILFPVGVLYAIGGVLLWVFYACGWIAEYPGLFHANWMVGGFLLSLSAGFLLTAVPRFTGTTECRRGELICAAVLACAQVFHLAFTVALLGFLVIFAITRIVSRRYSPPPHFVFVGLGLAIGIFGAVGMVLSENGVALSVPYGTFRIYFLQGTVLSLIVGIGARLLRVLLGYDASPLVQISTKGFDDRPSVMQGEVWYETAAIFILFLTGFVLESFEGNEIPGRWIRALAVSGVALRSWRIYRFPPRRGALVWGLYLGCWSVVLGVWAYALFPGWEAHSAHILFIGGFSTLALMVGSRVTLAHGGYSLGEEIRSRRIYAVWALLVLAMATRVSAPMTKGYLHHLGYAGATAAVAFLVWGAWMLPRLRHSSSIKTSLKSQKTGPYGSGQNRTERLLRPS